jgi:DeoR/GlpR family transcriptional regulator of sugar metabolism
MMDSSKIGKTSLHRFVGLAAFTDIIVTKDVPMSVFTDVPEATQIHIV